MDAWVTIDTKVFEVVDILEEIASIEGVECSQEYLSIPQIPPQHSLLSRLDPKATSKTIIVTAPPQFKCGGVIVRRVSALVHDKDRAMLRVFSTPVGYGAFVKDLHLSLWTSNVLADDDPTEEARRMAELAKAYQSIDAEPVRSGALDRGWFGDTWTWVTNKVQKAVETVVTVVETAAAVITTAVTGAYGPSEDTVTLSSGSFDKTHTFSDGLTIQTNGAYNLQLTTAIEILDYTLKRLEIVFHGGMNFGVIATIDLTKEFTFEKQVPLATIPFGSYTVALGPVPLIIEPSMPIFVGTKVTIAGTLTLTASYAVDAKARLGMKYRLPRTDPPYKTASPDGWCSHAGAVHQDVPGCGRVCSDALYRGVKNAGTWGPDVTCSACPSAQWPANSHQPACPGAPSTVTIGPSSQHTKTVAAPANVKACQSPCGPKCRLNSDYAGYPDTFDVVVAQGQITVTRTDSNAGWGLNLQIPCYATAQDAGGMQAISESQLTETKDWSYSGEVTMSALFYVMPTIDMKFQLIGGPAVGLMLGLLLEDKFETSGDQASGLAATCSNVFSVKLHAQLNIGAFLDIGLAGISVYSHRFTPAILWDYTKTLYTAELDCSANARALAPATRGAGIPFTYSGWSFTTRSPISTYAAPQCPSAEANVTLTIEGYNAAGGYLEVAVTYAAYSGGDWYLFHRPYRATGDMSLFVLMEDPARTTFESSTDAAAETSIPYTIVGRIAVLPTAVVAHVWGDCFQGTLYAPLAAASKAAPALGAPQAIADSEQFQDYIAGFGMVPGRPPSEGNASFNTTESVSHGGLAYGFYTAAAGAALPALSASQGSFRMQDYGPGVAKAVVVAMDPADAAAALGTAPTAPADAIAALTMISITRYDSSGAAVSQATVTFEVTITGLTGDPVFYRFPDNSAEGFLVTGEGGTVGPCATPATGCYSVTSLMTSGFVAYNTSNATSTATDESDDELWFLLFLLFIIPLVAGAVLWYLHSRGPSKAERAISLGVPLGVYPPPAFPAPSTPIPSPYVPHAPVPVAYAPSTAFPPRA